MVRKLTKNLHDGRPVLFREFLESLYLRLKIAEGEEADDAGNGDRFHGIPFVPRVGNEEQIERHRLPGFPVRFHGGQLRRLDLRHVLAANIARPMRRIELARPKTARPCGKRP
jgi:hypothetical protein